MKLDDSISVRFCGDMFGVFTNNRIKVGDVVWDLGRGEPRFTPTRTSIQVGDKLHVEDSIGAFINHDCKPSCKVVGTKVIAVLDMGVGDEITFDYSQNEDEMASPFVCRCCGKLIKGNLFCKEEVINEGG